MQRWLLGWCSCNFFFETPFNPTFRDKIYRGTLKARKAERTEDWKFNCKSGFLLPSWTSLLRIGTAYPNWTQKVWLSELGPQKKDASHVRQKKLARGGGKWFELLLKKMWIWAFSQLFFSTLTFSTNESQLSFPIWSFIQFLAFVISLHARRPHQPVQTMTTKRCLDNNI